MARGSTITVRGFKEFEASVKQLIDEIGSDRMSDAMLEDAEELRDDISAAAPLGETGNLKRDVKAGRLKSASQWVKEVAAWVKVTARHGHLVEYGHGGPHPAAPHPFFRPTVRKYRKHIKVEARLKQILRKSGGK